MAVGWFAEDIVDAVVDVATSVTDRALDVLRVIPGAKDLEGALSNLLRGPLRELASTPYGMVVLRAMATTIYGPLAWEIGPQVASIAFALPGVVRGQDFWEAWFDEVRYRAEKTAEIVGPGFAGPPLDQLKQVSDELLAMVPEELAQLPLDDIESLAKRFGVSDWAASMGRWTAFPDLFPQPTKSMFVDSTGMLKPTKRLGKKNVPPAFVPTAQSNLLRMQVSDGPLASDLLAKLQGKQSLVNVAAPAPEPVSVASSSSSSLQTAGDVALVGVATAAAMTIAWWYLQGKRRT